MLRRLLERKGYDVIEATDGVEALALFEARESAQREQQLHFAGECGRVRHSGCRGSTDTG